MRTATKRPIFIKLVESGEYKNKGEIHIRRIIKKYLIHLNGHFCSICNISNWRGIPILLICDHIDGNSKNNELNNFRLVCPNCDSQLPTFKNKNIGMGREYDRNYRKTHSR